jgi:dUTP pyrophosphatase
MKNTDKKLKIMLDTGAKMPTRAHEADAGLDIYAATDGVVPSGGSCTFDTGVHAEIPNGYVGMLKSKSGLNCKHGLVSEGVIDAGYTGSIVVKLYNHSETHYAVKAGEKISQLVILPIITPELELVDSLEDTERGNGGFGSTGK